MYKSKITKERVSASLPSTLNQTITGEEFSNTGKMKWIFFIFHSFYSERSFFNLFFILNFENMPMHSFLSLSFQLSSSFFPFPSCLVNMIASIFFSILMQVPAKIIKEMNSLKKKGSSGVACPKCNVMLRSSSTGAGTSCWRSTTSSGASSSNVST